MMPEQTRHNNKKYSLCYYFSDSKHVLSIPNLLFVPESERKINNDLNNRKEFKKKLSEVEGNFHIIRYKVYKTLDLIKNNQKFKNMHVQIEKSKQACDLVLKLKNNKKLEKGKDNKKQKN
jgi:hypothetical protein